MEGYEVLFDSDRKRGDSSAIMKAINDAGMHPIIINVDNAKGSVTVYFEKTLSRRDKEKIEEIVKKSLQEVVDIGYS